MSNKYYDKNNYEEFYNDWNGHDDGCRKNHHKNDCCKEDWKKDDCCKNNWINEDCCFNDRPDPCRKAASTFGRRPIRRCDEDAIEAEINNLFRRILNELCNVEENIDAITSDFVRLANLLIEDTCLEASERELICCVAKDLKALQVLIDKTIRDTKCLRKDVKSN